MAEKVTIDVELKQDYRKAVKEVQNLTAQFGATSEQVKEAAKKAADLKDKIEDANDAVLAFKGEGAMLATSKALSSVASGFAAVQGAMGLLGVEGESVEKTLLKVQSAMAIADGLAGLEDFGRSFKQLKTVAVNAFQSIKTAIGSTGIGLLVVAIGTLYAYWDDIKAVVSGVSEEQERLNKKVEKNLEVENRKLETIGSQDNILKLQGKSEKEILKYKLKQIDATILATEAQIKQDEINKKNQIENTKRYYNYLKSYLDFVTYPTKKLTEYFFKFINSASGILNKLGLDLGKFDVDKILKGFDTANDKITKYFFDPEGTKNEANKTIREHKEALNKLKNDRAGYLLDVKNIDKQAFESNKKTQEELNAKLAEENYKNAVKKQEEEDLFWQQSKELGDKEIAYKEAKAQKEREDEEMLSAFKISLWENENRIKEEEAKKEEERQAQLKSLRIQSAYDGLSAVSALVQAFAGKSEKQQKRAFEIQKAISIAQAVIDTYRAANAALATGSAINPAFGIISAATAIATGLANVAVIAKQKWQSPSALSGGSGGRETSPNLSQGSQSPNLNVIQYGQQSQLAQLQQQPIQAYVVSGEITSQQALDRNRLRNATL